MSERSYYNTNPFVSSYAALFFFNHMSIFVLLSVEFQEYDRLSSCRRPRQLDETTYNAIRLPGAKRGDDGSRSSKVEVLTTQVSFPSTVPEWVTVSGERLHEHSLDDDMIFDPISLTEAITPGAVESNLASGNYSMALRMAVHLKELL
jgi:hypothetical protein